jgi:glyoxylase-like metal-dependent hydrolase (beta-lactamase superfamily II)
MRRYFFATTIVVMLATTWGLGGWQGQGGPAGAATGAPEASRKAYRFEQIAEGVHFATGTGAMTTMSNSMVIVNSDHVMLVDTSVTPAAARALVAQIKSEISDKPIRYVFNSHYHFDHAHGNQIFGDEVEIIGHEYIRRMHLTNVLEQRTNRSFTANLPNQIAQMKERIAKTTDPGERAKLEASLGVTEAHYKSVQETVVKPPNVTFTEVMTLHKGGREVQLHFLGRGHTGGDTMVFLPAERIVFTGDFFEGRPGGGILSYLGDSFIDEWPASLERLKALDFDIIVPGHGAPFKERQQISDFQNYLREFWRQAAALRTQGVTVEQAIEKMDLSRFTSMYGPRSARPDPRAVARAYELLQIQMPM